MSASEESDRSAELSMGDRAILVLRGLLQFIPLGIGGAIEVGYFGTLAEKRWKRVEALFTGVRDELERIVPLMKSKVGHDYFATDEFAYLFEHVLRRVTAEVNKAKLAALRGALVSIIVDQPREPLDKESFFLKSLDVMEGIHIQVLRLLAARTDGAGVLQPISVSLICSRLNAAGESDHNFVYSTLDTLANREFIISGPVPFSKDGRINKPVQEFRCTALGLEFLRFVRLGTPDSGSTDQSTLA